MRNTIHLVSARDYLGLHGLFAGLHARAYGQFGLRIAGVDLTELLALARQTLEAGPRTGAQLGTVLARRCSPRAPDSYVSPLPTRRPLT